MIQFVPIRYFLGITHMMHPVIAVIGSGNMGQSIIKGLLQNGHPHDKIWATDPDAEKLQSLNNALHIHTTTDNQLAVAQAGVILFAVKPQSFKKVASDLKGCLKNTQPLIISIAAGVREASIQDWLGGNQAIVRTMPNTPALIGAGATGMHANSFVSAAQKEMAERIMRAVGLTVWLTEEHLLDAVTALSGSGPAYFFHMMEALQHAAEELGLTPDIARLLTLQTALGSARMAIESGLPLSELRENVTSKGGTTEKALAVLNEHHVHELYKKAMKAAKLHAEDLAKQLGDDR